MPEPAPMAGVELEILAGRITWTVEIPEGQATGPAALQVEGPQGVGMALGVQVAPAE